jgi:hypothetical protein
MQFLVGKPCKACMSRDFACCLPLVPLKLPQTERADLRMGYSFRDNSVHIFKAVTSFAGRAKSLRDLMILTRSLKIDTDP